MWSGLPVEIKVFNLFSGLTSQEGLSRMEAARQRQSIVPDLRINLSSARHQNRLVLHELKVISASQSRYKPSWEQRAVDVRAGRLQAEYVGKARVSDTRHHGTGEGEVGPVQQKLLSLGDVRGLVFGNFGEASQDCHTLVAAMTDSRIRVAGPVRGIQPSMRGEEYDRSSVISSIRRRLSVAAVKAQAFSLLGRLDTLGPGQSAAAGRRRTAAETDRLWRLEEAATKISRRQGRNINRTGFAKLD